MAFLHIDTHIDLFRPTSTSVEAGSGSRCAVYHSELALNGTLELGAPVHVLHIHIAFEATFSPLQLRIRSRSLTRSTNAYMSGTFHLVGRSLMVTADELIPLYVATTPATRAAAAGLYTPYISLAGVVSSGRIIDVAHPAALVVDVEVKHTDRNPADVTIIRSYFNRDEKRFRTLVPLVRGTPVLLLGKLFSWTDGKLAIDVDEIRCNNIGQPPSVPLALYPYPFARCQVVRDYGVFVDTPPAYTARALSSSSGTPSLVIDVSESDDDSAPGAVHVGGVGESAIAGRGLGSRAIRARSKH